MSWQDEVSPEQWAEWQEVAQRASKAKKIVTTLGAEDYAASAMERLFQQPTKPANVEAWLRKAINNQYIDRFRKIEARGGISKREWSDEQWEHEMVAHAVGAADRRVLIQDEVDRVLRALTPKEKELLILSAAGYDNHQIAIYLGYKDNKIVATRLGQITEKVRAAVNKLA